jgi:anti-sigma-K factor RskA
VNAAPDHDRLHQLLADRATQGLSAPESAELDRLMQEVWGAAALAEEFELAAAAADLAMCGPFEELPGSIRQSVESRAAEWMQGRSPKPEIAGRIRPASAPRMSLAGVAGWLAAAACLALAASVWLGTPRPPPAADPAADRAALLAGAKDLVQVPWAAAGELENSGVAGDIIWSTAAQRGYMAFEGLRANDPAKEQYQLWIFDPAQSDKTPIDGGVFDAKAGRIVVPIDPKIRVTGATLFAVTIEKPGGVVVSDRSRLVLVAKPG